MSEYRFSAQVTVSISTTVEADTEEEARVLVEEREMQSLCHYCASGDENQCWSLSGELDGTAQEVKLAEIS